jgi:putative ABC transport system permease protein
VSLWRHLGSGLRVLLRRRRADQELATEVQHYLDQSIESYRRGGMTEQDARRAALAELGNTTVVREEVRSYGWENGVEHLIADLRFATRKLRANPGFTTVAVLTLALGIGATTAIFSAVNPILFEPLPYPSPKKILSVWDAGDDGSRSQLTFGTYREVAVRARSLDATAVFKPWQPTLTGAAQPERLEGQRVSADYFRVLGVSPALGRVFDQGEDRPQGANVAIISNGLWHRRFAADSAVIGRRMLLDDVPFTIVGVMPDGFENVLGPTAEAWSPLQYDASLPGFDSREWGHHLRMIARVRHDRSVDQASGELASIARTPVPEFSRPPWASLSGGFIVGTLQDELTRAIKPAMVAVVGAVLLLLTIACVNVTNLLLARSAQRRGELSMRAALGADRSRLVRQLLTESVLLSVIGGVAGLVVAAICTRALVAVSPPDMPRLDAVRLDGAVFLFALGTSTIVGILIGLAPALRVSRGDAHVALHESGRRATGRHAVANGTLVVTEVALALVLLVGAGLLLRSLERLFAIAPGFDASRVLTMQVQASGTRLRGDTAKRQFFEQALDAVRRVPGVDAAAFTSQLPLSGDVDMYGAELESDRDPRKDAHGVFRYAVTPSYFATMRIPLRQGRLLDDHDGAGGVRPVLINESFARRSFPGRNALGQRIRAGGPENRPWDVIVGVVGDVKQTSLSMTQSDAIYVNTAHWLWVDFPMWLVVRTRGDAAALTPAVKSAIWSVDKDQPIVRVGTMQHLVDTSEAQRHFAFTIFEAFALAALVLAATGIYGVLSGRVTERTREIGIRSALGASRGRVVRLIVRQGMTLTTLGVVLGVGAATIASRAVVTLLFGVTRLDPVTYVGVVVVLAGVSLLACALPAWRASRVDPAITLRAE